MWITGGSGAIGRALVEVLARKGARVVTIGRTPVVGTEHVHADLGSPASWTVLGEAFAAGVAGFAGRRVRFVQAAGTLEPIGFAEEVDADAYAANVVVNSAAFQVLGQRWLAATAELGGVRRQMLVLSSGAARTVYPGWSSYGAAKAAVEQWVRTVGAEQARRGGAEVLALGPGTVAGAMQDLLRATPEAAFPARQKFVDLHRQGRLVEPVSVAERIVALLDGPPRSGEVLDLRSLNATS